MEFIELRIYYIHNRKIIMIMANKYGENTVIK